MKHRFLTLLAVPVLMSCGSADKTPSIPALTVDELGVEVAPEANREYSYTDKKAGYWYGRTHQDEPTDWYAGWNQAKRRIFSDYVLTETYHPLSYIKSVTFPNNKSKSLVGAARMLVEKYGSEVPSDFDELVKIPGVGRKTANVMLAVIFNKAAMAVDTHVFRVSNRIGLTNNSKTPLETEKTLVRHFPAELLPKAHHWLILHGRYVCTARKPQCEKCGISAYCKYFAKSAKASVLTK